MVCHVSDRLTLFSNSFKWNKFLLKARLNKVISISFLLSWITQSAHTRSCRIMVLRTHEVTTLGGLDSRHGIIMGAGRNLSRGVHINVFLGGEVLMSSHLHMWFFSVVRASCDTNRRFIAFSVCARKVFCVRSGWSNFQCAQRTDVVWFETEFEDFILSYRLFWHNLWVHVSARINYRQSNLYRE